MESGFDFLEFVQKNASKFGTKSESAFQSVGGLFKIRIEASYFKKLRVDR